MDMRLIARALLARRNLRARESWTRQRLDEHRRRATVELRNYAYAASPFYRRFHRGLEHRPLEELPVLTKEELMTSFNELVTDRRIQLADVEAHLRCLTDDERFLDRYRVVRTSGSTGSPGIFLANEDEWTTVIASYGRAQEWAGINASITRRTRLAVVSSRVPWHQSSRVGMSVDSPFIPVRRFDATQPVAAIVEGLNAWQPENLVAYASMARVLADEQLAGRLRIQPRALMSASEVLTDETRERVERAWGIVPFNVYAATETAGIASECEKHRLHLFEDLVVTEIVDERDRPVPAGVAGSRALVTVLFSRTQPLIRYAMSDCLTPSSESCDCGLPFALLERISGRTEDVLSLPTANGNPVAIHPNVFHAVLEPLPVSEWQVVQAPDAIRVLLVHPRSDVADNDVQSAIERALEHTGAAHIAVRVERPPHVERTGVGKAPLVKALHRPASIVPQSTGTRR